MNSDLLFSEYDLFGVIQSQTEAVKQSIEALTSQVLTHTTVDAEAERLQKQYQMKVPVLDETRIEIKQEETQIDVSHRMDMMFFTPGPHYRPALKYSFFVPFTGDPDLFRCRASQFSLNPPRAEIRRNELVISHIGLTADIEPAKATLKSTLDSIKQSLQWLQNDIANFNSNLEGTIRNVLAQRQSKLSEHAEQLEKSGFKVRR